MPTARDVMIESGPDGFDLKGCFNQPELGLPKITFVYRPALPEAVYGYQVAPKNTESRR